MEWSAMLCAGRDAEGQARCSRVLAQELDDTADPSFAPAAPFIASFTGAVAAGQTLRTLMGEGAPDARAAELCERAHALLGDAALVAVRVPMGVMFQSVDTSVAWRRCARPTS